MRVYLYAAIIFFLLLGTLNAQERRAENSIIDPEFNSVIIKADAFVEIEILTTDNNKVEIEETRNGELSNLKTFQSLVKGDVLYITELANFTEEIFDDKLAAHKVVDAKLKICLPVGKKLRLELQEASVKLSGDYSRIHINQQSGKAMITDLSGDLIYRSISANVSWYARNYFIRAIARNGRKEEVSSYPILFKATLESLNGKVILIH